MSEFGEADFTAFTDAPRQANTKRRRTDDASKPVATAAPATAASLAPATSVSRKAAANSKSDTKHSSAAASSSSSAAAAAAASEPMRDAPATAATGTATGSTTTITSVKTRGLVDRPDLNHTLAAPPAPSHPARAVNPYGTNSDASIAGSVMAGTATGVKLPQQHKKHTAADNEKFGSFVEQTIIKSTLPNCVVELCLPPNWDEKKAAAIANASSAAALAQANATAAAAAAAASSSSSSSSSATAAAGAAMGVSGKKPAKEYKFTLDAFQRESIACLERNQSVLVSAHTSAGKTVVAEYAIAMSLRDKQRVIYTSPIKALSNQKYRDLEAEFGDVGLMTGDITVSPSASCLVMTTEILRNMLYNGSSVMREVAWVIFDEIHYMRDKDRGVVWEETIILLPDTVKYVFLSATIPNANEFALWVAKLHNQPCSVVYTDFRPTPLQHYLFPSGADGLYLVVDEKGEFRDDNFQKALAVLAANDGPAAPPSESDQKSGGGKGGKTGPKKKQKKPGADSDIYKLVKMINQRGYNPVIVFSFSKRDCESHALAMSKLDFCDESEKKLIDQIFSSAMDSLSDDDKHLPQVENILPLLKRGIGIHHGGLLPIVKEVIEILFQEGLIKVLFSTETFSMGVNFPAKTVVFTSIRKFDGQDFRMVTSGEYIQMSGRAGRRGLDERGLVITMMEEKLEPPVAKEILKGKSDRLVSAFHLGYNMLLNLLRVEDADPEYMMSRSFHQFQANRSAPELQNKLDKLELERDAIKLSDSKGITEYHTVKSQLDRFVDKKREIETLPIHILPFLNPGRLVKVRDGATDWGWGIVVNFQKKTVKGKKIASVDGSDATYIVDVLLRCDEASINAFNAASARAANRRGPPLAIDKPTPPTAASKTTVMGVVPILLPCIDGLSSVRLFVAKDLRAREARDSSGKQLAEVIRRFPDGIPMLDPIEDMKIKDVEYIQTIRKIETLEDRLLNHPLHKKPELKAEFERYERRLALEKQCVVLRSDIKSASADVVMRQTLINMKRVLKRLGFTTSEGVIDLKGRVACEISTCDELLGTELMFSGVFNDLTPELCVALLSCLIFNEKNDEPAKMRDELSPPFRALQELAKRIATVTADAKLPVDLTEYVAKFQPTLCDVVYSWCKGGKFSEIAKMTEVFEGTIIRAMRRLEELLRQMAAAAKSIGNDELDTKFRAGIEKLKRDIVFAASLYL